MTTAGGGPEAPQGLSPVEAFSRETFRQARGLVAGEPASYLDAVNQLRTVVFRHYVILLNTMFAQRADWTVQVGPFAGMRYVDAAVGAIFLPKVLGTYEAELHGVIGELARRPYDRVVNVGAGEGYYAVGMARLMTQARVYAFETDPRGQELCGQLARLNQVEGRVEVRGECRAEHLRELAGPGALLICDCEGAEDALLDPAQAPGLAGCDLVVECHDHFVGRPITETLLGRFRDTHVVCRVEPGGRDPYTVPVLRDANQLDQWVAMWEGRPAPTPWLVLTRK
jgi:hypothetical protein